MPTLVTILAAILRAVGLTSSVLSIVNGITAVLKPQDGGPSWKELSTEVIDTQLTLANPINGLAALAALIDTARTDILAAITALGSPTQTGVPVDVSSGSQGDIGSAVWAATLLEPPFNMYALMQNLNWTMQIQGQYGAWGKSISPYVQPAFWGIGVTMLDFQNAGPTPDPKPGNLLTDDTLGSWLTRECPDYNVTQVYFGTKQWILSSKLVGAVIYVSALDEAQFTALKALYYPPALDLSHSAPIWPGIGEVTLLTPVAFSDSFTISEPMQGVLIEISTAPSKQGTFSFDGLVSYRNAGALTFLSDDGEAEISKPLGFTSAVYLPATMVEASAVKVRVEPGIAGTCTPFTIP